MTFFVFFFFVSFCFDVCFVCFSLQIRLADGTRLLGQFNHGHTIGQVRSYIINARPQYETREFVLLSAYPTKELEDDGQTIKDAGILNSAIMQKLL